MSTNQNPSVVLSDTSFAWPDGTPVLNSVSATFGPGRTGLIGANGSGKTTVLRLIARYLTPTAGSITTSGPVGYLPQDLTLHPDATVADLLGIRSRLDALRAIEAGRGEASHFDALSDAWDIESITRANLDRIGLDGVGLDRFVTQLSGGEAVLIGLVGLRMDGNAIVLLDEPTNNLDRDARNVFHEEVLNWRGALIIVSHDTSLLDLMDDTVELRDASLTAFGGNFSSYREHLAQEQTSAQQALRTAQQKLRSEQRQKIDAQTKLSRRSRYARKDFENKRLPKVVMNLRKSEAQISAGKLRGQADAKVELAKEVRDAKAEAVRTDSRIEIDLPDPDVASTRRLAELADRSGTRIVLQGPERVALIGRNGIGKTRLLETLLGAAVTPGMTAWAAPRTKRIGYLPQRLDHLVDDLSIVDSVRQVAPTSTNNELRSLLARFLFRADVVDRSVGQLSGGERFRVALARLLLAQPPNQLLVLDEPTNSLDMPSVDALVSALEGYKGGLLVVSHDDVFLDRLHITTRIRMGESGLTRY